MEGQFSTVGLSAVPPGRAAHGREWAARSSPAFAGRCILRERNPAARPGQDSVLEWALGQDSASVRDLGSAPAWEPPDWRRPLRAKRRVRRVQGREAAADLTTRRPKKAP